VLETNDWAGKYIPIIPVYGEDLNIEGKRHFRSLVRDAKDPQRMFNYWRTTSTELVALAPEDAVHRPEGRVRDRREKWATANTETHAYIEYDGAGSAAAPAVRGRPGRRDPGGAERLRRHEVDHGAARRQPGRRSNETSGVAIMARQREGDVSSFHFIDNLSALDPPRRPDRPRPDPEGLLDAAHDADPGPEGDAKTAVRARRAAMERPLVGNSPQPGRPPMQPQVAAADRLSRAARAREERRIARVFDLTVGKYDLVVTAGPSYTTQREEAASQMIELIRAYPAGGPADRRPDGEEPGLARRRGDRRALQGHAAGGAAGPQPGSRRLKAQLAGSWPRRSARPRPKIQELETDQDIDQQKVNVDKINAETNRVKAVLGKDGAPYDAAAGRMPARDGLAGPHPGEPGPDRSRPERGRSAVRSWPPCSNAWGRPPAHQRARLSRRWPPSASPALPSVRPFRAGHGLNRRRCGASRHSRARGRVTGL
jgi:hypothetical protein